MSGKEQMTVKEIVADLSKPRPISERKVYRLIHRLKIRPLGKFDQKPQQYPEDTAAKMREALGLPATNGHAHTPDDGKVVTIGKLKRARAAATKRAA
jgi:hypothetical protein